MILTALRGHAIRYDAMQGYPVIDELGAYARRAGEVLGADYRAIAVEARRAVADGLCEGDVVEYAVEQIIGDLEAAIRARVGVTP